MHIAFVTFEYPPDIIGGAGVYAGNLVRELGKLGHRVEVFTWSPDESGDTSGMGSGEVIHRLEFPAHFLPGALAFWMSVPGAVRRAEREDPFDIIHFNGISYWFLKKKISGAPHVTTIHHLVRDALGNTRRSIFPGISHGSGENHFLLPFIEKRAILSSDRIIAVSEYTRDRIITVYRIRPEKITRIYNGFSVGQTVVSREEISGFRSKYGIQGQIVLFVGRVNDPRKGLSLLLHAFSRVSAAGGVTLLVAGGGDPADAKVECERLRISRKVVFMGFVDDPTLQVLYSAADIFVSPSKLEGFGLTILEALAAGIPVIATDVGAVSEVLGDCGILVGAGDEDELAGALQRFLTGKEFREEEYIRKCKERPEQFSWKRTAEELVAVYHSSKHS